MIELLRARRSIREYTDQPIEAEKIELLKEAALRSPSSRSIDPWEFIFVDDRDLLKKLARCKPHGVDFLERAALGVIVCASSQATDVWVEDCSIAAILLQMAAQSIGLGSCWIQVRNRMYDGVMSSECYIQKLLDLPANIVVECIVAMGYPAEQRDPLPKENLKNAKIWINDAVRGKFS